MIKINLGCGPGGIDGWINYDWGLLPLINKFPFVVKMLVKIKAINPSYITRWPKFFLFDIRKKFKENNSSTDVVYCSQVLEHLEYWQALDVSKEVYRILKKGGIYRVSVPDAQKIMSLYKKNKNADMMAKNIWGFEKNIKPQNWLQKIGRYFIRDHQWLFDEQSMIKLLSSAGFNKIKICDYRIGMCPDIDELDLVDHQKTSLYIEAIK